jgi:hypothetical protein
LVEDYKPETIARTIHNLLKDKTLLSKIKDNQQKAKKVLCWEIESKKLDNYFK